MLAITSKVLYVCNTASQLCKAIIVRNMKITKSCIEMVRKSPSCQAAIAEALGVSLYTVQKYIRENSEELTKAAALDVLMEHTGLTRDEILEKTKA